MSRLCLSELSLGCVCSYVGVMIVSVSCFPQCLGCAFMGCITVLVALLSGCVRVGVLVEVVAA